MKYCYACGHTTGGEPFFCNSCGCSYDVKLCLKLHANPRFAEACSQCGSRDLSTPQPRVPLRWRFLAVFAQFASGTYLTLFTLSVLLTFFKAFSANSPIRPAQVVLIVLSLALWSMWLLVLPRYLRGAIYRSIKRTKEIRMSR